MGHTDVIPRVEERSSLLRHRFGDEILFLLVAISALD